MLSEMWKQQQDAFKATNNWIRRAKPSAADIKRLSATLKLGNTLRSQMLSFLTGLMSYMFSEVLECRFEKLLISVQHANSFDQLIADHTDFLDSCLKECLLTNKNLLEVIITFALFLPIISIFSCNMNSLNPAGNFV
jgi:gamma-tubulin complex component 2